MTRVPSGMSRWRALYARNCGSSGLRPELGQGFLQVRRKLPEGVDDLFHPGHGGHRLAGGRLDGRDFTDGAFRELPALLRESQE